MFENHQIVSFYNNLGKIPDKLKKNPEIFPKINREKNSKTIDKKFQIKIPDKNSIEKLQKIVKLEPK